MAHSILSLLGIYNYDDTILDDLALPPELEASRETIVNNLLLESAELEILFPDPVTLKTAVKFWSRKSLPVWQELYDTTQYEYNPIWNKDGTYTELETRDLAGKETRNLSGTETRNLTGTETRNLAGGDQESGTGSGTTDNDVYGYNSETAAHESKVTEANTYSRTSSSTQTGTISNTDTGTIGSTDTGTIDNTDTGTIKRERTEQGNIGITSTQELIERQRAVVDFNIMDRIIKDFISRFCILVY